MPGQVLRFPVDHVRLLDTVRKFIERILRILLPVGLNDLIDYMNKESLQ